MSQLALSTIAALFGSLVLSSVYYFIYRQEEKVFLKTWAIAWVIYSMRFVAMVLYIHYPYFHLFFFLALAFAVLSGYYLFQGVKQFVDQPLHVFWKLQLWLNLVWLAVAYIINLNMFWSSLPSFMSLGVVFFRVGFVILQSSKLSGFARNMTGWAFILWAIHKLDYPLLRPVEWFAPVGYLIGWIFEITVAIGILLTYYQITSSELRISKTELENRSNELEVFSHRIANNLNVPVRHLKGFTTILNQISDKSDCEDISEYTQRILAATEKIEDLAHNLAWFSRSSQFEIQASNVNMSELAEKLKSRVESMTNNNRVEWKIEPDLKVAGDSRLLSLMLEIVFKNACKFTLVRENPIIEFGSKRSSQQTVYFVKDNGTGFSEEKAGNIFQPFQNIHGLNFEEGKGIGLTIVKRIVEQHKGEIWTESVPDGGATFYFTLHGSSNS